MEISISFVTPQVTKAYVTQVTMQAWFKSTSLYGVKIKSKFRQQISLKTHKKYT